MIKPTNASIRQVCPACGGIRSLADLTDMHVCRSERACMDALLEEAMGYNPTINKENEVERRLRIAIATKADPAVVSPTKTVFAWRPVYGWDVKTECFRKLWLEWVVRFRPLGLLSEYSAYKGSETEFLDRHGRYSWQKEINDAR